MSDEIEKHARSFANASGYLFQWAIRNEIGKGAHAWRLESWEHAWSSRFYEDSGFADLLVVREERNVSVLLVMECKRHTSQTWVFHCLEASNENRLETRCLLTTHEGSDEFPQVSYPDALIFPGSPESDSCTLRGQGNKSATELIEREATNLIRASECIAAEYAIARARAGKHGYPPLYVVPVIVTNAPLSTIRFDPNDVSLDTGTLPSEMGEVRTVPMVRFRKSLVHRATPGYLPVSLSGANQDRERTVLIMHAPTLTDTLENLEVTYNKPDSTYKMDLTP